MLWTSRAGPSSLAQRPSDSCCCSRREAAFSINQWSAGTSASSNVESNKEGLAEAIRKDQQRAAIEATIPRHLLFSRDWPTTLPTLDEATLLTEVRLQIAQLMGLRIDYTEPHAIQGRYSELIDEKARRDEEKAKQIVAKGNKVQQPDLNP